MIDHDIKTGSQVIPVTVLTGFLGAGKTTMLNRILNGDHGLRIAVLVNDFGSINIDSDLVVGVEAGGSIISLSNGCVCCSIRDDLMDAVIQVIGRPERPEYIVLEASGVAEPSGIAVTFMDPRLGDRIRLDSLMCLVDASQIFAVPEMMELKLRQIAFADMLILNKTDLVNSNDIVRIREWLDEYFSRYRLVEAKHGEVPLEILLSSGRFDASRLDTEPHNHSAAECSDPQCEHHNGKDHSGTFSTWSYETDQPLSLEALRETARNLPASIYRCKGIVHSSDVPGRRAVLQVVGKRVDLTLEQDWGDRIPGTKIIAIGAYGTLEDEELRKKFDSCITDINTN